MNKFKIDTKFFQTGWYATNSSNSDITQGYQYTLELRYTDIETDKFYSSTKTVSTGDDPTDNDCEIIIGNLIKECTEKVLKLIDDENTRRMGI